MLIRLKAHHVATVTATEWPKDRMMIIHTLIFSFAEDRTPADLQEFFTELSDLSLASGLCSRVESQLAQVLPGSEAHPPEFSSSAITQMHFPDLESVVALATSDALVSFIKRQQAVSPYKLVFINHDPW